MTTTRKPAPKLYVRFRSMKRNHLVPYDPAWNDYEQFKRDVSPIPEHPNDTLGRPDLTQDLSVTNFAWMTLGRHHYPNATDASRLHASKDMETKAKRKALMPTFAELEYSSWQ